MTPEPEMLPGSVPPPEYFMVNAIRDVFSPLVRCAAARSRASGLAPASGFRREVFVGWRACACGNCSPPQPTATSASTLTSPNAAMERFVVTMGYRYLGAPP